MNKYPHEIFKYLKLFTNSSNNSTISREHEENTSSMAHQRVFMDLNDSLDCYDDLELVRRFRCSRASISQITESIANYLNFT